MNILKDISRFLYRSDTFPQKQLGQLWDTLLGKVVAVLGVLDISGSVFDLPLGLVSATVRVLHAYEAYLNRI